MTVAFGHPLFYYPVGATSLGMNDADVLTVLDDPSGIFGPFKLANLADAHGTMIQDRHAGVLGIAGSLPPLTPVTSDFSNPDLNRSRIGETDVVDQEAVPYLAFYHVLANLDIVFDQFTEGTLRLHYTIEGTREDGTPWSVEQSSMTHSRYGAQYGSFVLLRALDLLEYNKFEEIEFTSIHTDGFITEEDLESQIVGVLSSSSLQKGLRQRSVIRARAGSTIHVRILLRPAEGGDDQAVDLALRVPRGAKGKSSVQFRGGKPPRRLDRDQFSSFEEILDTLNSGEHSYELIVDGLGGYRTLPQDFIVKGREGLTVQVVG